jgi:hypothetical protein
MRNAYKISAEKAGVKGPVGNPRSKWEDNIKIDINM